MISKTLTKLQVLSLQIIMLLVYDVMYPLKSESEMECKWFLEKIYMHVKQS